MTTNPVTEAGRALLDFLWDERKHARFDGPELVKRIAAIEQQAAQRAEAEVARLREVVKEAEDVLYWVGYEPEDRTAVLMGRIKEVLANTAEAAQRHDAAVAELREALAEIAPLLDAAWARAEKALPEGWWIHAVYAWSFDDMAYRAEAASPGQQIDMSHSASVKRHGTRRFVSGPDAHATGPTPAAALIALAEALEQRS